MKEKRLILITVLIIFVSFVSLASIQQKYFLSKAQSGQWSIYFSDPKLSDTNFVIDNQGGAGLFSWTITDDQNIIRTGSAKVAAKEKHPIDTGFETNNHNKLSIEVKDASNKTKSIYKSKE